MKSAKNTLRSVGRFLKTAAQNKWTQIDQLLRSWSAGKQRRLCYFMLNFQPITLDDRDSVLSYLNPNGIQICEYCFTDLFIWKDHYETELCFSDGFLYIRMKTFPDKKTMYLLPIGSGDLAVALDRLRETAQHDGREMIICSIPQAKLEQVHELLPDHEIKLFDGCWDYIYLAEKIISYAGKKMQSKRNFVNRFCKQWDGRWSYEEITAENWEEAYQLHLNWCETDETSCRSGLMYSGETCAVSLCLHNLEALGLRGGMLRIDGKPIAFSLGSPANNDTFVIQIEKADSDIPGAYPMIAQQFAKHNCAQYTYINREEDLGIPGLRQSKKSYRPHLLAAKYTAVPKTSLAFAGEPSVNLEEI